MARHFTAASSEKINISLGAGASITGAMTLAAIVKSASDIAAVTSILAIGNTAAGSRRLTLDASQHLLLRSGNATTPSTTTVKAADGWVFVAATKAAGTATPRYHFYKYATGTWTHEDGAGTLGDSTPVTSSVIGALVGGGANPWDGDIAITGAYASNMTDQQTEGLAFAFPAWFQIQPNGLWLLDQASTSMNVIDLTGNGADQSGITGTSVSTSSVPVFSYGHPIIIGATPAAQSAAITPATVTVTPQALGASPGTASAALTPAQITVAPQALGASPGTATQAITPATVTVTPSALGASPGTATAGIAPAVIQIIAQDLGAQTVVEDTIPITLNIYDQGHTLTIRDTGHTATLRDRGHTKTLRENR